MKSAYLVLVCFAASLSATVLAQNTDDEKYIGGGVRVRPAYQGANSSRVDVFFVIRVLREYGRTQRCCEAD